MEKQTQNIEVNDKIQVLPLLILFPNRNLQQQVVVIKRKDYITNIVVNLQYKKHGMTSKHLYIIAGCNGAGKTTASFTILPEIIHCKEFINADEIAKGLAPFQPEKVAFEAGRIMLHRIDELLKANATFAFETTLATKSYKPTLLSAKEKGYTITLLFFWLQNVPLAIERVKVRVAEGGHHIPHDIIERRYYRGINNLFHIYLPIVDDALIFDNSLGKHLLIAKQTIHQKFEILHSTIYNQLKAYDQQK